MAVPSPSRGRDLRQQALDRAQSLPGGCTGRRRSVAATHRAAYLRPGRAEYHRISSFDFYLGVDGISIYFVLLTTIIMPIALLSN